MMDLFGEISEIKKGGSSCMIVTVADKSGEGPQITGAKMLVLQDGTRKGTVGGGALEQAAYEKALELLADKRSLLLRYDLNGGCMEKGAVDTGMVCGGVITLLFEYAGTGTPVYIFGAGHVGRALAAHLCKLDYHITVIDDREGIFTDFRGADRTVAGEYAQIVRNAGIQDGSFVIIATPGHEYDYTVLREILLAGYNPSYIGLLSSRAKLEGFIGKIRSELGGDVDLSSLYSPAGLDIGGASPDEIAISIIAEMQALKYGKAGHRHLREDDMLSQR